jgi:hypothetical protein
MTYAWYGHLKDLKDKPLWIAIGISWAVALLEYCFQVPANRMGAQFYSLGQLKVIQEIITMLIFGIFAVSYLGAPLSKNFVYAGLCLVGAAYFIFRDGLPQ